MKPLGIVKFGDVTITVLSNSDQMTVAELTFEPGVVAALHHHLHEEVNYVLEGTFEMQSDGKTSVFNKGDILAVPSGKEHNISHNGEGVGKVLTIWTPSRKDIIEKLS